MELAFPILEIEILKNIFILLYVLVISITQKNYQNLNILFFFLAFLVFFMRLNLLNVFAYLFVRLAWERGELTLG